MSVLRGYIRDVNSKRVYTCLGAAASCYDPSAPDVLHVEAREWTAYPARPDVVLASDVRVVEASSERSGPPPKPTADLVCRAPHEFMHLSDEQLAMIFAAERVSAQVDLMTAAACNGSLRCLKLLTAFSPTTDDVTWAAKHGHLEVVRYLTMERGASASTFTMMQAVLGNHLPVVQFLEAAVPLCPKAVVWAAGGGSLPMVEYITSKVDASSAPTAIVRAAEEGHLDVVRYLVEERHVVPSGAALEIAAKYNRMSVAQYLMAKGLEPAADATQAAAVNGHLDMLRLLGATPSTWMMAGAAAEGHLHIVKFCVEEKHLPPTIGALRCAAHSGFLDVVKYLVDRGVTPRTLSLETIACNDFIGVVRYLVDEQGLTPSQTVVDNATKCGCMLVLRYLAQEKAMVPSMEALLFASRRCNPEVVDYLVETVTIPRVQKAVDWAAEHGHLLVLRFLIEEAHLRVTERTRALANDPDVVAFIDRKMSVRRRLMP